MAITSDQLFAKAQRLKEIETFTGLAHRELAPHSRWRAWRTSKEPAAPTPPPRP